MPTDRERIESLFEEALELEAGERLPFVIAACGTNEVMRDAVLQLLSAHARAGVLDVAPDTLFTETAMPARLGAYRLLREIGRGGMGVVYDAERDDGQFRRRAAVKIIRQGSDPELLHRILAERQILAGLDHPNIARLIDGGVTPDGRPYLVMEHVDGLPIDVYCERMRFTVAERLRLFTVVARAVEFAHRNLIVHRDLKPSNILVTPDGRPKLLDFGVAKLLNPWLSDAPITRERQALTLEYASPEQLRGESLTTTSDVYSLGVVLYELLTGRRPHEQHEPSLPAHTAAVCRGDIEHASTRVLRAEQLRSAHGVERALDPVAVAEARQVTPARLARQLRGDVDAILEMALRAEPVRRYGSAELMAQDIERHLADRAVHARQGSGRYAFTKLVRRHRVPAIALALATLAVLGGAAASAWQATVARRERQRAEAALSGANQVADFLVDLFNPGDQLAAPMTVRDVVQRGEARLDQLGAQPDVQARMLAAMGVIHESLGEYEEGQRATDRALALLRGSGAEESAEAAKLLNQLGRLLRRRGEYDSAQTAFFRAREIQQRVLAPSNPDRGETEQNLARIAIYLGDFAEAERRAQAAADEQLQTLGEAHRMRVNMLTQLAAIQRARGNHAQAERTVREALALRPRAVGSTRSEILNDRFQLATIVNADSLRAAEAEALFRAELPGLRDDSRDDIAFITWAEEAIADITERRGDLAGGEQLRRHVHELRATHLGREHPGTVGAALNLAGTLLRAGRAGEAHAYNEEAVESFRRTLGPRHPTYAAAQVSLSETALALGRLAAADSALGTALSIRGERYGPTSHGYVDALRRRALVRTRMGRYAEAETMLNDGLRLAESQALTTQIRAIHLALAELYTAWSRPADARRHRDLADTP
ncbi:MAG TPA: tetratricopeptide repeat protein [Longimicrobiales bacterium]